MQYAAAALLLTLAAVMFRRAVGEIRAARLAIGEASAAPAATDQATPALRPLRLAGRMTALTMMNPLTIVAFTSLVVATGERASNLGWPLGLATASVLVHGSLVALGSTLRHALPPLGPSWFRVAGSLLITGLAVNLVLH
jgi:hypothetical protein